MKLTMEDNTIEELRRLSKDLFDTPVKEVKPLTRESIEKALATFKMIRFKGRLNVEGWRRARGTIV